MTVSVVSLLIVYHCVGKLDFIHSFSIVMSNTNNTHILKKRENCVLKNSMPQILLIISPPTHPRIKRIISSLSLF